jgi:hypothetical protein
MYRVEGLDLVHCIVTFSSAPVIDVPSSDAVNIISFWFKGFRN